MITAVAKHDTLPISAAAKDNHGLEVWVNLADDNASLSYQICKDEIDIWQKWACAYPRFIYEPAIGQANGSSK